MKAFWTIGLLIISNIFMTFAWYGHLKMKQTFSWFETLPLIGVVAFSWCIAFFEYVFQVPANRIGITVYSLPQLKIIQEVITLSVFIPFAMIYMGQPFKWDFVWAGLCLLGAVYFMFRG